MKKFVNSGNTVYMVCSVVVVVAITILMTAYLTPMFGLGVAAFVVFGPSVNDKYGKEGAEINSHNAYGHYTRGYKIPASLTSAQSTVRQRMTIVSKLWKGDSIDRESFVTYSENHPYMKRGRTIKLRANAWFNEFNIIANLLGIATITTAPVIDTIFPAMTGMTLDAESGPDVLTLQCLFGNVIAPAIPTGCKLLVYASRPTSAGVMSYKTPQYYLLKDYPMVTTPIAILTDYEAKFGVISANVGQFIWIEARMVMPTGESTIIQRTYSEIIAGG